MSASSSCFRTAATSCSPRLAIENFFGVLETGAVVVAGVVPAVADPFPATAPFDAPPLAFARVRFGGEPSVASAAARREPFRAVRAAGVVWAGSSARVRGATIVEKV
jgi:hypothetical protein